MDLEKISASVKPRNGWQSIDLGILMVRAWWKPLFGSWFLFTLPIFLVINVLTFVNLYLPLFLFWWLKPFFETVLLYYLSRALFGDFLSIRQTVKDFPAQGRIQMFQHLTYRRFSPFRSLSMPVSQLEKLTGSQRRQRISLLLKKVDVKVLGSITICVHLEFFLAIAFNVLYFLFIPIDPMEQNFEIFSIFPNSEGIWSTFFGNLMTYLSISLIAPFHVAAGFSIYINRRASLEGWDIELIFRRIKARYKKEQESRQYLNSINGLNNTNSV